VAQVAAGQTVRTSFDLSISDGTDTITDTHTYVVTRATTVAKSSSLTFISDAPSTTLHATSGADVFTFGPASFGNDTIVGFNPAQDILQLSKTQFSSFSAVQADEHAVSGATMITLDSSNSISLQGIASASITSNNVKLF
jgi:hypothetical protein